MAELDSYGSKTLSGLIYQVGIEQQSIDAFRARAQPNRASIPQENIMNVKT